MVKNIGFGDTVYTKFLCPKRPVGEPFYINGIKHTDYTIKSDVEISFYKEVVICVSADGTLLLEDGQTVMHDGRNYCSFLWPEVGCNILIDVITEKEYAEVLEREKYFEEHWAWNVIHDKGDEYEVFCD